VPDFLSAFRRLTPWRHDSRFSEEDISAYERAARLVQRASPADVARALREFQAQSDPATRIDDETRLFLLLRFLFDLPEHAPAAQRRSYWGWVNWPAPDAAGNVNLSWPLSFDGERPVLLAGFEGAEGSTDAVAEEYEDLRTRFPLRKLPPERGER
jgi:hypothetical protein